MLCNGSCNATLVRNQSAGNALTLVLPNGAAKVAYNPQFMQSVQESFGEEAIFGILAHETGHVIDGRTQVSWMLDSWGRELRADAWAGCALARAKMSTSEMRNSLQAISQYPSPSHPGWNLRIPALETGYRACGGIGKLPTDW